jgi:MEMO1 family protein
MRTIFVVLLSIIIAMDSFSQNSDRKPVAAGRFYPADSITLKSELEMLFKSCKKTKNDRNIRAIIVPHAGYVYSGEIAASAFSVIPANTVYENIFIIGSSHIMAFKGASVYNTGNFITPLGKIEVNREIANDLIKENKVFNFPVDAHSNEHSIEVQLPFIQYYFKSVPKIVPIIIGTDDEHLIKKISEALKPWFKPENLFIISSDFSHYPQYKKAVEIDNETALSICSGDPQVFLKTINRNSSKQINGLLTSMCGWSSGLTLLYLTEENKQLSYKKVDYANSGDSSYGDKDEVVGYNAIVVSEKEKTQDNEISLNITEAEKRQLFDIAKNSIKSRLFNNKDYVIDEKTISENLKKPYGAFITLKINGILRGCIGRFISSEQLYKVVQSSALSSAFEDPRFPPLTRQEFDETDFEITVLGPMKQIYNKNDIILGKHGIYIKNGLRAGTMLPQVAIENHWSVDEFLGYTSRDKAGIGWDGWKNSELFIYEGIVLEDNGKK